MSKTGIVKFRSALAVLPLAVFAIGCSSSASENDATSGSQADTTSTAPDFVFDGSFGYHGDGTRTPGSVAHIVYDTSRLPKCRATQDGVAAWSIVAFVSADGGAAKQYALPSVDGSAVQVPIEIPYATDMAIWFEATDESGCTQWDSSYGNNFHFNVAEPTRTVVHFNSNFTTTTQSAPGNDYPLKAGQVVDIDYDFARLSECRSYSANVPAWQITMFYQRNGGTVVSSDLNVLTDNIYGVQQPGHIELPAGTTNLTLWFENDDTYGCNAWDSNYSQNYSFSVNDESDPNPSE